MGKPSAIRALERASASRLARGEAVGPLSMKSGFFAIQKNRNLSFSEGFWIRIGGGLGALPS